MSHLALSTGRPSPAGPTGPQALEWPDLCWLLRDPLSGPGHVQMVLRLGYGPDGPPTPRRPVDEVLTITA